MADDCDDPNGYRAALAALLRQIAARRGGDEGTALTADAEALEQGTS